MTESDITRFDATALMKKQAEGTLTAVQITDHYLARIAGPGAAVNAVIHADAASALETAAAIDARRAAGAPLGLLAGIPITIKDSFAVMGMPASDGRPETLTTPASDAPVVANVRRQDAVLLGKTNVAPLLADYQTDNKVYGRTVNPWDAARTPGGSSGGSSAAVSAGLTVADIGSDLAGSLRIPASWTGVFGHFPSHGLVSKRGHLPWPFTSRLEPTLSTTGPLTRSARDLGLMLRAMIGAGSPASSVWTPSLPPARIATLSGTRIGLWLDDRIAPVDDETLAAVEQLAGRLSAAGCVVTRFRAPAPGSDVVALYDRLKDAEIAHGLTGAEWSAAADRESRLDLDSKLLSQSLRQAWRDAEAQAELSATWDAALADRGIDLVLAPSVAHAAPRHSDAPVDSRRTVLRGEEWPTFDLVAGWSKLTNVLRAPCTVIPAGLGADSGLPIGAQLVGPRFADLTTIAFAHIMETAGLIQRTEPPAP